MHDKNQNNIDVMREKLACQNRKNKNITLVFDHPELMAIGSNKSLKKRLYLYTEYFNRKAMLRYIAIRNQYQADNLTVYCKGADYFSDGVNICLVDENLNSR